MYYSMRHHVIRTIYLSCQGLYPRLRSYFWTSLGSWSCRITVLWISNFPFYLILQAFLVSHDRPLFCLFSIFLTLNFTEKNEAVSGIRTRIVEVEGKDADHLTTNSAPNCFSEFKLNLLVNIFMT